MSEQASWQGNAQMPAGGQMIDTPAVAARANPARTVTADSFKALLTRLKSGPIQQSIVTHPQLDKVPVPVPVPAPVRVTAPVVLEPELQPPPKQEILITAAPAPVAIVHTAPTVVESPPLAEPEIAPTESTVAVDEQPAQRRPIVDPELEFVMRLIAAVPSSDDRLNFINEAAALAAAEKVSAQPEGELAALEEQFIQQRMEQAVVEPETPVAHASPVVEIARAPVVDIVLNPGNDVAATHIAGMDEAEAGELARSLLDMMASSASTGLPHERALAADTLLRLVPRLPLKPLILLADRLSIMEAPPHLLIAKLMRDPRIEVSGPLLENSPHITDQDLAQAIAEEIPAKRRLIARRRRVTREISDLLIATNDASVQLTLVRNGAAEISHNGFLQLSSAAATAPDLLAPLCTRSDLPAPFAFELFWIAPVQLRRYLLNRFLTDSETLTKILKITLATQGGDDSTGAAFPESGEVTDAINLILQGQVQLGCEKLSVLAKISAATVGRIFSDTQGEPVAILLKAIGCQRNEFVSHVEALSKSEFVSLSSDNRIEDLQSLFDTMSFNKARILLTYWDWAVLKSGPYAPLH